MLINCHLNNNKLPFHTDNFAFVAIINKKTSKLKRVMYFVRPLVFYAMINITLFKSSHISSKMIADSISRKRFDNTFSV